MKIRYKATMAMLGVVVAVSVGLGYANYTSNVKLIESGMNQNLHTVSDIIQTNIDARASVAASLASVVVNQIPVQEALRARDRDRLIKTIVPPLTIQKEKYGEVDGHFHVPPATSFLRVYKIDTFGDDLSKTRELVLSAQKQQRPLQGVEISTTGVSIKGIDVVKDSQGFIGTFEVGESFDAVLESVKKITGFDAAAFVNNDLMIKIATKAPVPDKDRIIGGYRSIFATNWEKIQAVVNSNLMNKVTDITYKTEDIHGNLIGLVIIPLMDFKGQQIGSIWAVGDFSVYQKELRVNLIVSVAFAILQALILAGVVLIIFSSFFLMPIENIVKNSQKWSEGKLSQSEIESELAHWLNRPDEIGSLAGTIQRLNQKIQEIQSQSQNSDKGK